MAYKWKVIIAALLFLVFFSPEASAGLDSIDNLPSHVMDKFDYYIYSYYDPLKEPAKWLFVTLGLMQMVLTFGFMFLRGEYELGVMAAALIRFMLFYGLFLAFFDHPDWMEKIFDGFTALADRATHGNISSLDSGVENIESMWQEIWKVVKKNSWHHIPSSLAVIGMGIIATIAVSILVGYALMTYGFFIFSLYVGVFWLGFGSFEFTRPWAINSVVNVIRWGAKWMMQLLIIAVTFSIIDDAMVDSTSNLYEYVTLVIVSLIMVTVSFGSSAFVDSYFNGHGGGDNNMGVQMAQAFVSNSVRNISRGAQQGASTGYSAVKEAAAAGGDGGRGSTIKTALKATGGAAVGAAAGMTAGAVRSFAGGSSHTVGQGSGAFAAKAAGKTIKGGMAVANAPAKAGEKIGEAIQKKMNKDRTGFDMSQLKNGGGSSTGEIKQA